VTSRCEDVNTSGQAKAARAILALLETRKANFTILFPLLLLLYPTEEVSKCLVQNGRSYVEVTCNFLTYERVAIKY